MLQSDKSAKRLPYYFGAAIASKYKERLNRICEDAYRYKRLIKGYGIVAVADGLGSCLHSALGAKTAVYEIVESADSLIRNIQEKVDLINTVKTLMRNGRNALKCKAEELGCDINDLACTAIIVLSHKDNLVVGHIGDGAVVARLSKGLEIVSQPGKSEYANLVVPLTSPDWENYLRINHVPKVECFAVFTDGCQNAVLKRLKGTFSPYPPFFNELFDYALRLKSIRKGNRDIRDMLKAPGKFDRFDDSTMVVGVLKKISNNTHYK